MKNALLFLSLFLITAASAATHDHSHHSGTSEHGSPGNLTPVGIMGDHLHPKGGWMFSYRYMHMNMDGNRDSTKRVSEEEVLADFMVAPQSMDMDMHMFGGMYAVSDKVTFMAMVPWITKDMDHVTRMGTTFSTHTNGIGDASLSALFKLTSGESSAWLGEVGIGLPTGSVTERGTTPMGPDQKLPYPMQLGSGSWELRLRTTYSKQLESWSWGAQASALFRLNENSQDYRLGEEYSATAWSALELNKYTSVSFRGVIKNWDNISGADPELNPMMVPTARTDLRGGTRADFLAGLNLHGADSALKGQRLGLEFGVPVYQSLDGPQLETDWNAIIGYQYTF